MAQNQFKIEVVKFKIFSSFKKNVSEKYFGDVFRRSDTTIQRNFFKPKVVPFFLGTVNVREKN